MLHKRTKRIEAFNVTESESSVSIHQANEQNMNSPSSEASCEHRVTHTEYNTGNDLVKSLAAAPHIPCILVLGLNRSHARETNKKFPRVVRSGNDELLETEASSLEWKKFGFSSLIWLK